MSTMRLLIIFVVKSHGSVTSKLYVNLHIFWKSELNQSFSNQSKISLRSSISKIHIFKSNFESHFVPCLVEYILFISSNLSWQENNVTLFYDFCIVMCGNTIHVISPSFQISIGGRRNQNLLRGNQFGSNKTFG